MGILRALFGWPGTWGAGGNLVAWVLCGAFAGAWLRAKLQAQHLAQMAQAAKHHKVLLAQAQQHHEAQMTQAGEHHAAVIEHLTRQHEQALDQVGARHQILMAQAERHHETLKAALAAASPQPPPETEPAQGPAAERLAGHTVRVRAKTAAKGGA